MIQLPPLSLYVHIPWCIKKCPYCDFNSHTSTLDLPEQAYVKTLTRDLNNDLPFVQGRKLRSIFFGGGTPSLFNPKSIETILQVAQQQIGFSEDTEITLEANPGTFEQEKFSAFKSSGINRLSIGIQSFDNQQLQYLGRIHNRDEAISAVEMAKKAGFENFNIDLMHGLPHQQTEQAMLDLKTAIELTPTHLSWYQLTIEANTEFYKHPPPLPSDDVRWEIYQQGQALLAAQGYQQYEVSAYSDANNRSQHNLNYWNFGDYLGIGAGAHGKITQLKTSLESTKVIRTHKTRSPKDYLDQINIRQHTEMITPDDIASEFIMNGLRLKKGFTMKHFIRHTGLTRRHIDKEIAIACDQGLLRVTTDNHIQATTKGWLFLDDLIALFL